MIGGLLHELRFAVRTLGRSTLFAALTVATLAVGLGATTALFAVVKAVLLAPIVSEQDRVVRIWKHDRRRGFERVSVSYQEFLAFRDQAHTLDALAAIMYADSGPAVISIEGRPVVASLAPVSWNWFSTLHGSAPLHGRWFDAADDRMRDELAAVVSYRFWQRAAGADPSFVGRRLTLGVRSLVVVGIAPPNVEYPLDTDIFVTIPAFFDGRAGRFDADSRRLFHFEMLGRLAPGNSMDRARAELDVLSQRLVAAFPDDYREMPVVVSPLIDTVVGNGRQVLLFLFAAAGLVFVIAGVNVAALLLMRASDRQREMAVRVALGASQGRLARQTLSEGLVLGVAGAVVGFALAWLLLAGLKTVAAGDLPRVETAALDRSVLAFGIATAIFWVLALGTAPLWRRDRRIAFSLQRAHGTKALRAFSIAEIAAAVVVAVSAGLLVRSFLNLEAIDRGFRPANLSVMSLVLPEAEYPDARRRLAFFTELLTHIRAVPGVINAAPIHLEPGTGTVGLSAPMMFEGQTREEAARNPLATWEPITPSFFETMRIPIVRGRAISDADTAETAPVAVVSESIAQRYWPGQDPIGKRVQFIPSLPQATVVGVAADVRYRELTRDWLTAYFPGSQFFFFAPHVLAVRTSGDAGAVMPAIREVIRQQAPTAAIESIDTMDSLLARDLARPRAALLIATLFASMAIALAAVGIYGVLSYELVQRRRDWAVRSAVGASPERIFRDVLGHSTMLGVAGAAAGTLIATAATRFMHTLLYEVEALDPSTFVAGAGVLIGVVVLASYLPARRAATTDPVTALRAE